MFKKFSARIAIVIITVAALIGWISFFAERNNNPNSTTGQQSIEIEQQLVSLQTKYKDLEKDHESLRQESFALETLNEMLRSEKESATQANLDRITYLGEQITKLESLNQNGNVNELKVKFSDLENKHKAEQQKNMQLQTLNNNLEQQLASLQIKFDKSDENSDVAGQNSADLETPNGTKNNEYQQTTTGEQVSNVQSPTLNRTAVEQDNLQTANNYLETDNKTIRQERLALTKLNKQLETQLDNLQTQNENLKIDNEALKQQSLALQTLNRIMKNEQDSAAQTNEARIAMLEEQISNLQLLSSNGNTNEQQNLAVLEEQLTNHQNLQLAVNQGFGNVNSTTQSSDREMNNPNLISTLITADDMRIITSQLVESNDQIKRLSKENERLQEEVKLDLAKQTAKIDQRINYLATHLGYARDQLRRNRAQRSEALTTSNKLQQKIEQLNEQLLQAGASSDYTVVNYENQIDSLKSKYAAIRYQADVLFDSGSTKLSQRGRKSLTNLAILLNRDADGIISIEGHTDNVPIADNYQVRFPSNWELSGARASSAARFLVQQGVPENRMRIVGHGALQPIRSNDTEVGRASNRRIEIRLVPELADRNR